MSIQTSSIDRHELERWKTPHILGLDSLRGILSIIVLYAHTYQIFITPLQSGGHSTFGYANGILARCAVLCFFVLSGHVITLSIDSNHKKNGKFDLLQYLGSRFFRIVPPLLVVFCLTLIASLITKSLNAGSVSAEFSARKFYITDISDQIRSLLTLCTSGDLTGKGLNGPLWSLTYEIQLYIISGLLACVIFSKNNAGKILFSILAIIYVEKIGFSLVSLPRFDFKIVSFISFGFGSISYMYRKTSKDLLIFMTYLFGFITFLGIYYTDSTKDLVLQVEKEGIYWLCCQVLISILLALMVLALVRLKPQALNLFYKTGQFSYTLYIAHFPILLFIYFVLAKLFPIYLNQSNIAITSSLSFIFALLFSLVLARLIEQPKLQRQFAIQVIQSIINTQSVRNNKDTHKQNRR